MVKRPPKPAAPPPADPTAAEGLTSEPVDATLARDIARGERRLRVLEEVTEIGMRLMRQLEAPPAAGEAPHPDPAAAFARYSRAVRITLELEARTEETLRALRAGELAAREQRRAAGAQRDAEGRAAALAAREEAEKARRDEAAAAVTRQVRFAIEREADSPDDWSALSAALHERLEYDVAYERLHERPLREVVEQLCHDLCLEPDWSGWTEAGWPDDDPDPIGPALRAPTSPFTRPSRKPLLKITQERFGTPRPLEPAWPP